MKECCNESCVSPFCPHCGRHVNKTGPYDLLAHISNTARRERTQADKAVARRRNEPETFSEEYVQRHITSAEKWAGWLTMVKEWIKRDDTGGV